MEDTCGIYKITNPKKKIYIGQGVDVWNRKSKYKSAKCKDQPLIYNSIKKYGWEKHKFEIICFCSESDLDKLEDYYITLYDSRNRKIGLNIKEAGHSGRHSEETKQKIRLARSRQIPPTLGFKHSKETILKMRLAKLGKPRSEEVVRGMMQRRTKNPKQEDHINRKNRKKYNLQTGGINKKSVVQFTQQWQFIRVWHSATDAGKSFGRKKGGAISACCIENKKREIKYGDKANTSYGYIWVYEKPDFIIK